MAGDAETSINESTEINESQDIVLNVNVRAQSYPLCISGPGRLWHHLFEARENCPWVIMPSARLYVNNHGEFPDAVARAYAAQNHGIFFAGRDSHGPAQFLFSDYIQALKILTLGNAELKAQTQTGKEMAKKLIELVAKAGKDNANLIPDSRYLGKVKPMIVDKHLGGQGVEGIIVDEKGEPRVFGDEKDGTDFNIKLALAFSNGFGYSDFDIVGRRLSMEIPAYRESLHINQDRSQVIHEFAYSYGINFEYRDLPEGQDYPFLYFETPRWNFGRNQRERWNFGRNQHEYRSAKSGLEPTLGIDEMLEPFSKVAISVLDFLKADSKRRGEKQHAQYKSLVSIIQGQAAEHGLGAPTEEPKL
jgi:hypothetical protein